MTLRSRLLAATAMPVGLAIGLAGIVPDAARASTIIFNTDTDTITLDGSVEAGLFRGTSFTVQQQNGVTTFLFAGNLNFGATDIVTGVGSHAAQIVVGNNLSIATGATINFSATGSTAGAGGGAGGGSATGGAGGSNAGLGGAGGGGGGGGAGGPGDNSVGSDVDTSYGGNAGGGAAGHNGQAGQTGAAGLVDGAGGIGFNNLASAALGGAGGAGGAGGPGGAAGAGGAGGRGGPAGSGQSCVASGYFCSGNPHGGQGGQGGTAGGMGTNGGYGASGVAGGAGAAGKNVANALLLVGGNGGGAGGSGGGGGQGGGGGGAGGGGGGGGGGTSGYRGCCGPIGGGNGGNGGTGGAGNDGSAGGNGGAGGAGGGGGGAVSLSALGSVTLNGQVLARGGNGAAGSSGGGHTYYHGGGVGASGGNGSYGQGNGFNYSGGAGGTGGGPNVSGTAAQRGYNAGFGAATGGGGGGGGGGGNGGYGYGGGAGGAGSKGGGGAGGTVVISGTIVTGTGSTSTSGGAGSSTGGNGQIVVASNSSGANAGASISKTGASVFSAAGPTASNPFLHGATSNLTPYIPNLVNGAEAFGLLDGITSQNSFFDAVWASAEPGAEVGLYRVHIGPVGYNEDFQGYDALFFLNLTDQAIEDPQLGVIEGGVNDDFVTSLLEGGYATDALFGGSGAEDLDSLAAYGVYEILIPQGGTEFNYGDADGITYGVKLEDQDSSAATTGVPEPSSLALFGAGLIFFSASWRLRRRRGGAKP